jgi:hypothetical protein
MLGTLKHGEYVEQLNTKFRVVEMDEPVELELFNVSELKTGGGQESFSLLFHGAKDKFLPQKLYDIEHDTLGQGSIFLVPVGAKDDIIEYEAVFNRLTKD